MLYHGRVIIGNGFRAFILFTIIIMFDHRSSVVFYFLTHNSEGLNAIYHKWYNKYFTLMANGNGTLQIPLIIIVM